MTALYTSLRALRAEVEGRINDLEPNVVPEGCQPAERRFRRYKDSAAQLKPITEFTGRSRVYQLGQAVERNPHYYVGGGARGREYIIPITIVYARTERWQLAAMDDMDAIRNDLVCNATSVTGVQGRYVPTGENIVVTNHPSDPWDYHTINLLVLFDIS